ncbi:MAG: histone family protein [Halobacteriota archaeon]
MAVLPTAPIDRLMRNAGAARVSEAASKKMVDALEDYTTEIARKAVDIARHSGRKTVKAEDIKLALKQ